MEMLFDAGADPLANDAQGNSVMHHACKVGNGKYSVDVRRTKDPWDAP